MNIKVFKDIKYKKIIDVIKITYKEINFIFSLSFLSILNANNINGASAKVINAAVEYIDKEKYRKVDKKIHK